MIPRQREPLFTDEERRDLIHAMHSSWMAEALLSWMPRDEKFLAGSSALKSKGRTDAR